MLIFLLTPDRKNIYPFMTLDQLVDCAKKRSLLHEMFHTEGSHVVIFIKL